MAKKSKKAAGDEAHEQVKKMKGLKKCDGK